ncbi:MAG: PAS domain S-box protein [Magnetococcus sp. YQC-3]
MTDFFFQNQAAHRIRAPILVTFAVVLTILLTLFSLSVRSLHQAHEEETLLQIRQAVEQLFTHLVRDQGEKMLNTLHLIARDQRLQEHFLRRDRMGLQAETQELQAHLQAQGITHFYFFDKERRAVFRVYRPSSFGDRIDRHTLVEAEKTGKAVSGLELGRMGTLTLRTVLPWRVGEEVIGYLELGAEVAHLTAEMPSLLGVELHLFLDKNKVEPVRWQEGMAMLGREGNWEQFKQVVLVSGDSGENARKLNHYLEKGVLQPEAPVHFLTDHYLYTLLPIATITGEVVAWLGISKSDIQMDSATRLYLTTTLPVVAAVVLLLAFFLSHLLQLLERRIERANADLRHSEKRTRAILNTAMDAIISIDKESRILEFNPAAERIFGFTRSAVLGRDIAETIIPPELRELHRRGMARYLVSGECRVINQSVEQVAMDAQGNRLPVDLAITVVSDQEFTFFTAYLRDITERRQILSSLQESYASLEEANQKLTAEIAEHRHTMARLKATGEEFRSITDSVWDAIIAVDHTQRITFWNEGARAMFGYTREEILGKALSLLIPERYGNAHHAGFARYLAGGQTGLIGSTRELAGRRRDGVEFPMEIAVATWMEGEVPRFSAVIRDITGRRQTESSLREAVARAETANQAKSQFLATMSHEIRTPMNAIIGVCDLLLEANSLSGEEQHYLRVMQQAGETLMALINDILDLSKIEAGQMLLEQVVFDLAELVTDTVAMLQVRAADKELVLTCRMEEALPRQWVGDPQRVRQLLLNLLSNAIKFTQKGEVSVRVGAGQGGRLLVEVADTGIGIAAEMQEAIFQPFTQGEMSTSRRFGGTGLGLTICWKLVKQMGGQMEVESEPGRGSLFRILLPLPTPESLQAATGAHAAVQPAAPLADGTERKATILLVDDADDNRLLVRAFLKRSPCQLVEAVHGEDCLEKFKTGRFDLVLMDMQMPVMDGFEATRRIRAWEVEQGRPPVPVIALTAHAMREDVTNTMEAGCTMHLTKPITKSRLIEAIGQWVCTSGAAKSN